MGRRVSRLGSGGGRAGKLVDGWAGHAEQGVWVGASHNYFKLQQSFSEGGQAGWDRVIGRHK